MASPPPVVQPVPSRSPEKEASNVDLHHPLPDLQSLQGAYVGNISRLEEHAERMSEAGSDLNEEIRKLHTELKASDSRRSSLRSLGFPGDELARVHTGRSRNVSTSSHANSVIDTNGPARWGGYSPGGYVTSPVGSLRSGSLQRHRSGSKASRLGQVVHPEQVQEEREDPGEHPGSPSSIMATPIEHQQGRNSPPPQRQVSSFTRKYEAIANEIRDEIRNSINLDRPLNADQYADHDHNHDHDHYHDGHHEPYPHYELPDRPPTAASTDTTHQARTLWQDFDGTHAPDTVPEEEEPEPSHGGHSRDSSFMMRSAPDLPPQGAAPPEDDMVFYPAPVPRMLNLPKRLSQLPPSDVAARRRTQVLDQIQAENRKSAPWLSETDPTKANRKSRKSFDGLPAALRASAFFDQQAPSQEFEVKGESAEDTLDSILEASARAPVSAFTDHPFTGRAGNEVYGPGHKRKSTKLSLVEPIIVEPTKRRSSFNILDTNTNSSGGKLNKLKKRNSSADMNILVARAAESRVSLGAELDDPDEHARGPNHHETTSRRNSWENGHDRHPDDEFEEQALDDEEEEEEQPFFGAPTTLLAELQLRKAKQKERNMNYVTMVEEGRMTSHRTLLELNDDAEREHQKRLKKKVQLAWEAQDEDDSDDDIPLGVLYKQPQKNDWDRPLGLIAQRELEDSEPLSRRRERLTGIPNANRRTVALGAYDSQTNLGAPRVITPQPESEEEDEHAGETLGERMRRLKDKQMLDGALGEDVRKSTVSGDFAAEMLSKLGVDDSPKAPKNAPSASPAPEDAEEETLGQRRARLKAEAEARGDMLAPGERPAIKSKMSLADVLAANPYDDHHQARKVSNEQLMSHLPAGSLLHQNAIAEEKRKAQRLTQNMRASSYGMVPSDPLVRGVASTNSKDDEDQPLALKIQAYKDKMAGRGPQEQQPRAQSMMFNMNPMGMPAMNMSQPNMMGMNGMGMMSQPNLMMQPQMQPQMPMMGMNNMSQMSLQQPVMHPGMGNRQSSMPMQMSMMQGGPQMNVMSGMPMMQGSMMPNQMGMNGMGMPNSMGMGMGMNGMQMGGGMMDPSMMMPAMNTQQRSNIEGWMRGIR
jgi:hypothetical protein